MVTQKVYRIPLSFKLDNQHDLVREFVSEIKAPLRALLFTLGWEFGQKHGVQLVLTCLMRTQAEQDALYKHEPRYQATPWRSYHQFGWAADLRVWNIAEKTQAAIVDFVNAFLPWRSSARIHTVGAGRHMHVQVAMDKRLPVGTTLRTYEGKYV